MIPGSLATRIYILYGVTLAMFFSIALGLFYQYVLQREIVEAQESASTLAFVMAPTVSDSAVIGDFDTIKRQLEQATYNSKFSQVSFIDRNGISLAVVNAASPSIIAPELLIDDIAARLYDVNLPIKAGGRDYGVLRIQFDPALVAASIWQLTREAVSLAVLCLIAGLLLIALPLRHWLRALNRIQTFEQDMRAGSDDSSKALDGPVPQELRAAFDVLSRTAQSLREQLAELKLFEGIIDRSLTGVTIADARQVDYPLVFANSAFLEMTGFAREEIIGRNCRFLTGSRTAHSDSARIRQALTDGESITLEIENYRKSGEAFWNRLTLAPIFGASGSIKYFVGFQTDITEERNSLEQHKWMRREFLASQRLVTLGKLMPDAIKEIGEQLASMSNAISSVTEADHLADAGQTPAAGRLARPSFVLDHVKALARISSNVQRSRTLVHSVEEVSSIQDSMQWKLVSIDECFSTIVDSIRPTVRRSACEMNFECHSAENFRTSPVAVALVMHNLIFYALYSGLDDHQFDHQIAVAVTVESDFVVARVFINVAAASRDSYVERIARRDSDFLGESNVELFVANEIATTQLNGAITFVNGTQNHTEIALTLPLESYPLASV